MACLIKDNTINQFVGYEELTDDQINVINSGESYTAIKFYDKKTCKAVIENLAK